MSFRSTPKKLARQSRVRLRRSGRSGGPSPVDRLLGVQDLDVREGRSAHLEGTPCHLVGPDGLAPFGTPGRRRKCQRSGRRNSRDDRGGRQGGEALHRSGPHDALAGHVRDCSGGVATGGAGVGDAVAVARGEAGVPRLQARVHPIVHGLRGQVVGTFVARIQDGCGPTGVTVVGHRGAVLERLVHGRATREGHGDQDRDDVSHRSLLMPTRPYDCWL